MNTKHNTQHTKLHSLILGLWSLVFSLLLAGCAKQRQYEVVEQICVPGMDKAGAMQIAEDVLVKMNFTIEKADPNIGFMRTKPLPGAQFFEFWRKDNVGRENAALANLHTIRRIAELNFGSTSSPSRAKSRGSRDEEKLCIGCNVQVYRLSLPQRQSTSWAHAPEMFSESSQSMQRLRLNPEQKQAAAWVDLGQDEQLATDILKRIEKRLVSQTGHERVATRDEK